MKSSINRIRRELADIAIGLDGSISQFYWGDLNEAMNQDTLLYPLMCSYFSNPSLRKVQTQMQLTIILTDLLYKDKSNLESIESDLFQTCRSIFNVLERSKRWQTLGRVDSCSVQKFQDSPQGKDEVAGYAMTFQFIARDSDSICDIPMFDYDFDAVYESTCPPVHIYKSGALIDIAPAGTDYVIIPDPCSDGTINILNSDSDIIKSVEVPSGGIVDTQINDTAIKVRNSDGTIVATQVSLGGAVSADVEIPDTDYQIEVNGVLKDSFSLPTLDPSDITIELL